MSQAMWHVKIEIFKTYFPAPSFFSPNVFVCLIVVPSVCLLQRKTEHLLVCFFLLVCRKLGKNRFDVVVDTASRILSIGSLIVVRSVVYMFLISISRLVNSTNKSRGVGWNRNTSLWSCKLATFSSHIIFYRDIIKNSKHVFVHQIFLFLLNLKFMIV